MRKVVRALAIALLVVAMSPVLSCAETVDPADENYYKILAHNIEVKSVWLNPGQYIQENISQEYQELSREIVGDATSDAEKAERIYEWVTTNIYYDYDTYYGHSTISEEERAAGKRTYLQLRRGVCEGYAVILKGLLNAQEIPCFIIHGRTCDQSNAFHVVDQTKGAINLIGSWTDRDVTSDFTDHAWNAVFLDGEWIEVDATWDSGNRYINGEFFTDTPRRGYYNCGDVMMSFSHKIVDYAQSSPDDIPDGWAQAEILSAISTYIVPNDLQRDYRDPITREEFCELAMALWNRTFDAKSDGSSASPFADTQSSAVLQAYEYGIVNGVGAGRFAPDKEISRQEAAIMLMRMGRLLNLRSVNDFPPPFADQSDVADWGMEGVDYVRMKGLMSGTGNGFSPNGTYTIQEAILTFSRLNSRIRAN